MRALSLSQAKRCESSEHGRCRCRCGGVLHGAQRGMDEDYFASLPPEDPHRATVRADRQTRKRVKNDRQMLLSEIFAREG